MKRKIEQKLLAWKNSAVRKPLVVKGARQVGKTYAILAFGAEHYKSVIHLDFMKQPRAHDYFAGDLSPQSILRNISIDNELKIDSESTLLFFDEIQLCENALTSLKYFNEDAPEYSVISAGSLLGVTLKRKKGSYPVGQTTQINMRPLDFEEFLWAADRSLLAGAIAEHYQDNKAFALHESALSLYRDYLLLGGMPEVVQTYKSEASFARAREIQQSISDDYIADMVKYADDTDSARIHAIWRSLPAQLAKENTRFQFKVVNNNARARNYGDALEWLEAASVVSLCTQVSEGLSPLSAFEEPSAFKVYYEDVGLLAGQYSATYGDILDKGPKTARFRGGLAENYVMQQLVAQGVSAHYWGTTSRGEVDFVIQNAKGEVVPIEVKSGSNVSSSSLRVFMGKYNPNFAIRMSTNNFGFEGGIRSIPLYAAFCIK